MRTASVVHPARKLPARLGIGLWLLVTASAAAQVAPPRKPGFSPPLTFTGSGKLFLSEPLIADLGLSADGTKSIVFGTFSGELHVIYKNGSGVWGEAPGFPKLVGSYISSSPAAGDLDGDGKNDLVVGFGSNGDFSKPGGVVAYKNNGTSNWTQLWKVNTADLSGDGIPDPVVGTPAIGDVDGDGKNEVVFGAFDMFIYVVRGATGANEPGWPIFIRDTVWSTPALHDIDGDGKPDIVIGVDAHQEGPPFNTPNGGCLHVFRFDATQPCPTSNPVDCRAPVEIAGFPKCVDQVITGGPVVGDIDGDGKPEIVHGTGTFFTSPPRAQKIYAYHCDGSTVAGWPVSITGQSEKTPALADLDGDGKLDVVVTSFNNADNKYYLSAFRGTGAAVFAPQVVLDFNGVSVSAGPPLVADVLGSDATPEILVSTNHSVAVFSNTGTLLTEHTGNFSGQVSFLSPGVPYVAVGDLEDPAAAGAKIEVVAVGGPPSPPNTELDVWNPISRSGTPPWGLFHQNAARTGIAPGTPGCSGNCSPQSFALNFFTLPPCRVVDTRNAAGPLGGPALASGQTRSFTLAGACGIPLSARAVSINVTVTQPTGAGLVSLVPGACTPPTLGTLNFAVNQTRANNAVLALAADGSGTLSANAAIAGNGTVHLLIDVDGYFQ
jgi:hypothetical protein